VVLSFPSSEGGDISFEWKYPFFAAQIKYGGIEDEWQNWCIYRGI
jgi:hypothetical protein